MNWRQATYDTFEHRRPERIVWQPRLEHWYNINKQSGTLPRRYRGMTLLDLYRDLNCSKRSYDLFNDCFKWSLVDDVRETIEPLVDGWRRIWHTPKGNLTAIFKWTEESVLCKEFPVKSVADLPALECYLRARRVRFDHRLFDERDKLLGDLGAPTTWRRALPTQLFFIEYMGFESTIFALHEHRATMEHAFAVIRETGEQHFDAIDQSPIRVVNLGDNVDAFMLSPPHFEKYALSYYRHLSCRCHRAGKFLHAHWDGALRTLLPYAGRCGFDGLEALTPLPQGDVSLEEIREALPERMILIDGIPATHFLPQTSYKELESFTLKILDLFAPNLILGISDELPPPGDIEKVRLVSEIVATYPVPAP